jgi:metacaspase-1
MRHYTKFAIICLSLFAISLFSQDKELLRAQGDRKPRKLALLVGISKYGRGRDITKDWADLNGARDVMLLEKTLEDRLGFEKQDVLLLTDEKATHKGIIDAFQNHLISQARPGDIVVFHFSGHGQLMKDETGRKLTGKDECFVPYDYGEQGIKILENNPRLGAYEIKGLLARLCDKMRENGSVKGDIFVVLDTCHSGTGTRGIMRGIMKERGRGWDEKYDGPEPKGSSALGAHRNDAARPEYVFIAACESHQSAKEDPDTKLGILTKHMIKAIEQARPDSTYRDLFEKMKSDVEALNIVQDPQAEGNLDRVIFNGTVKPVKPYLLVKPLDEPDMIEISAGYLQGVTRDSCYSLYKAGSSVDRESNKMGELVITTVEADTSKARIAKKTGTLNKDMLAAARAVEMVHNYQSSLKVYAEGLSTETLKKLKVLNLNNATRDDYDVKIYKKNDRILLERMNGSAFGEFKVVAGSDNLDDRISRALLEEWRKRFLISMRGDALDVAMRLIKVDLDMNNSIEKGEPQVVTGEKDNELKLRDGDVISFEVCNHSKERVYINVIYINPEEEPIPLFPDPSVANFPDIIQNDRDSVPADGKWYRVPINVEKKHQSAYTWKTKITKGRDCIKLIATPKRIDLSPLFSKTEAGARGLMMDESPDPFDPFSLLLVNTGAGARAVRINDSCEKGNIFGTAELYFEVK